MSTKYIDQYLVFSAAVQVTAQVESYHLASRGPEPQVPVGYTLSFHLGARSLSRMDYPHGPALALLDGDILSDPVRLALRAQKNPGREKGLLRVVLAAAPTTSRQEAAILDADRSLAEGMALWDLPDEQIGLSLGDRWFPAGPEMLEPIPVGEDLGERLSDFEAACKPFFDRILYGDPYEEVERLVGSVGWQGREG